MSTRNGWVCVALAAALAFAGVASAAGGDLRPAGLRCEYLENPLGLGTATPRLSWRVEAAQDNVRGARQSAFQILAASSEEALAADTGDLWDSGKVPSEESMHHAWSGQALASRARVCWKVRVWDAQDRPSDWSAPAYFSVGLLQKTDWGAEWIGMPELSDTPDAKRFDPPIPPSPMLRRGFSVGGPIKRATLYITARGLYECRINGERVSERQLAPEWTDYLQRIQYQTHDVTAMLHPGDNAVGAMLSDGWYMGRLGPTCWNKEYPRRCVYGEERRLLARLEIELADGSVQTIVSDGDWKGESDGPVRNADLFMGEAYDARKEQPGWDTPGFDDSAWKPVLADPMDEVALVAQHNEPIRALAEIPARTVTEPKPGMYIFDLGQNFAGWVRMRVSGHAGREIVLRHGEMLNPDGTLYTENLRAAAQTDRFVPKGDGEEVFEPRFTYHGFRYVEVTGLQARPQPAMLTGRQVASAAPETGSFSCSNPMLNQLMHNTMWTLRANMHSVPTDCPQRDERMGWMGDAQVFAQSAIYLLDMGAFFTKWIQDIRDAQAQDGSYPDIAPHPYGPDERFKNAPGWADAGIIVPWRLYQNYGDTEILRNHIESARRFIDGIVRDNPDLIWRNNTGNHYGDWLNGDSIKGEDYPKKGGAVDHDIYATAFFAHSTDLVSRMCEVLGMTAEAARYRELAGKITEGWRAKYVKPDGRIEGDTQAGYALALDFGLLPEAQRAQAASHMVEGVRRYDNRISTGFQSTYRMMMELSKGGHHDVACLLAESTRFPSWGYTIEQGGTTIWERWDGYVEGRGFQDPGMNSFAHYAIGAVTEWVYRTLAGINPDDSGPGFKNMVLRPRPGGTLTWAKAAYQSIRGEIRSEWELAGNEFRWSVRVPANCTAELYVPAADAASVSEGGAPAQQAAGLKFLRMEEGCAVFAAEPGDYRLVSTK